MAADPRVLGQAKHTGMGSLTPLQGLGALAGILSARSSGMQPQPQFAVLSVDWAIILKKVRCTLTDAGTVCMLAEDFSSMVHVARLCVCPRLNKPTADGRWCCWSQGAGKVPPFFTEFAEREMKPSQLSVSSAAGAAVAPMSAHRQQTRRRRRFAKRPPAQLMAPAPTGKSEGAAAADVARQVQQVAVWLKDQGKPECRA